MASTFSERLWLKWLLTNLQPPKSTPTILHRDNQATRHISKNFVFHEHTKHVEKDFYVVSEHIESSKIKLLQPVVMKNQLTYLPNLLALFF